MTAAFRTLIVGAGGFARELYWWMRTDTNRQWHESFAGFLDDDHQALCGFTDYSPGVIDSISAYRPFPRDCLVMGIADPSTKLKLADTLQSRGATFVNFVHSTAIVVPNAKIGNGSVLCPGSAISCDTIIGEFVTLNVYAGIGHDAKVGDGSTLSAYAEVMGKANLGQGVFMGSHSSILPGVRVGDLARIAANSAVIRGVRAEATMVGVPARKLGFPPVHKATPQDQCAQ